MALSSTQIARANQFDSLEQKQWLYHPHRMLFAKCQGTLKSPSTAFGKYAYWHSYLIDDPLMPQGWYAEPWGDTENYVCIRRKFGTIHNHPHHVL